MPRSRTTPSGVLTSRQRLARPGGLGDNASNKPPEDEATQNRESAAPQRDRASSPDQRQREDRTAHPRAERGLPRAERISGAGDGDLQDPWHYQQYQQF